jgi:bile acid-coenzyme A ligase
MALVPYGRRISELAAADPARVSVTDERRSITRAELDDLSTRYAVALRDRGVGPRSTVVVALANSVEHVAAVVACWKLAATPMPVSSRVPERELAAIVDLAGPAVVIGAEPGRFGDHVCLPPGWEPDVDPASVEPLDADAVSNPWKALPSGGSTGRPKLILTPQPGLANDELPNPILLRFDGCLVMPGPLSHNGPFVWSAAALMSGNHLVLGGRFDAEATLRLVEEHGADVLYLVPTMMQRIMRLPERVRRRYDLSTLERVWHLGAPCAPWLKEAWIEWLGAETIVELYAGTEAQVATVISGVEWLEHRGSVGRPLAGEVMVAGPDGAPLPPGEVGEVFLRGPDPTKPSYEYVGAEPRTLDGGWESLGDMGWLDDDGYLYLTDRATDMVLVGGANVYPAEVEAALDEHPAVHSSAVIGLPDDDLGNRLHAIVHAPGGVDEDALRAHVAERLVAYKRPRTYELVDGPLRDDAGKVRRRALRDARLPG